MSVLYRVAPASAVAGLLSNTTGTIAFSVANCQQVQITLNGNVAWNNGTFQATSGVTGASASGTYVNLSVNGGTTYLVTTNP